MTLDISRNTDFLTDIAGDVPGFKNSAGTQVPIVTAIPDPTSGALNLRAGGTDLAVVPKSKKQTASVREIGLVGTMSITATMFLTRQAPAHYDAVQLTINGETNSNNTVIATVAPSSKYNNGYAPLNAAGETQTFTTVTWGTTSKRNHRNPGGGAASTTVTNASGTVAASDLIEGESVSDIIPLASLDRTDTPTSNPLIFIRLYGINQPGGRQAAADIANANPWQQVIPEYFVGYATGNQTVAVSPVVGQGWHPMVTVTFFLRGKAINTVGVAGDSLEQGWESPTAVPQLAGLINGWPRRLNVLLNAAGKTSAFEHLSYTGQKSKLFHERAMNSVLAGRLTHLFIKPWSSNETGDGAAALPSALVRTTSILEACKTMGVIPILIQPWGGQGNTVPAIRAVIDDYIAKAKASGIAVMDPRSITDTSTGTLITAFMTVNAEGSVIDGKHLNDAGHQAVAQFAFDTLGSLF